MPRERHLIRRLSIVCATILLFLLPSVASGYRVYIFRGGEPSSDQAASHALQDRGHSANLGIETGNFDGTQVKLTDFDVVVARYNANGGAVGVPGKTALREYLQGGGRLVTSEFFINALGSDRS